MYCIHDGLYICYLWNLMLQEKRWGVQPEGVERKSSLHLWRTGSRKQQNSLSGITSAGCILSRRNMTLLRCIVAQILWAFYAMGEVPVCEQPPDVDFGNVISGEKLQYVESDTVQYGCNPGYTLGGSQWIKCNGRNWTPPPTCLAPCTITKQQLEEKKLLLPSGRRRTVMILNDQVVEFSCSEGYVLMVPSNRKCSDGHMDFPLCISEAGKKCGRSPVVANGDITTFAQKEYTSGSFVEYTCQKLYSLRGQNKSFCDNGNWTEIPVCEEPCIISQEEMQNHGIELTETYNGKPYIQHRDFVVFNCKSGYVPQEFLALSNFTVQCNSGNIVYPHCNKDELGRCGPPPSIQNGDIISERLPVYSAGSSVEYKCQRFHGMTGSTTITCRLGKWTAPPVCSVSEAARKCGRPPAIINGDIKILPQKEYESGSRVEYRCQSFHRMRGSAFVSCESGQWTDPPVCLEPCTIIPEDMEKNNIHLKWTWKTKLYLESGDFAEFECKNEYVREPTSSAFRVQCMEGKLAYPKCKRIERCITSPEEMEKNNIGLKWISETRLNLEIGDFVEFECKNGYRRDPTSSEFRVQCMEGKLAYPKCKRKEFCITSTEEMEKNNIGLKWTPEKILNLEIGDFVEFECKNGFRRDPTSSEFRVQCVEGKLAYPKCKRKEFCRTSPEEMEKNNIGLKWTSEKRLNLEIGDFVEFECKNGYKKDPTSSEFRVQCVEGKLAYPKCKRKELCMTSSTDMEKNNIVLKWSSETRINLESGDYVEFQCKSGFVTDPTSSAFRVQCVEGKLTYPRCKRRE
ncbi:coagulation factor XIII B chain-like isoform X2 [Pelodiscus sinensis]|uniref:coagulation factor XIII B chain-like isoform X2 n=1 Tax=Pelodiscus sinensis TaxID=13735 RepID=UPI003F6D6E22